MVNTQHCVLLGPKNRIRSFVFGRIVGLKKTLRLCLTFSQVSYRQEAGRLTTFLMGRVYLKFQRSAVIYQREEFLFLYLGLLKESN